MIRLFALLGVLLVGGGCLGGDEGGDPSAADALRASATAEAGGARSTATAVSTPTAVAEPAERLMVGSHFSTVVPWEWLLLDPDQPLSVEDEEVVAGLRSEVRAEVQRLQAEAGPEVILTGLPEEADSRIVIASICDTPWGYGPGDWGSLMDITLRQQGSLVGLPGTIAIVEGLPYPLLEVGNEFGDHYSVHPVSHDGCVYSFSLQGAEPAGDVPMFVEFMEGVALGHDGGWTTVDWTEPPGGWTPFTGRTFGGALPRGWLHRDFAEALTAAQLAVLADLDPEVAAPIESDEGFAGLETVYIELPVEPYTQVSVLSFCDAPGSWSDEDWLAEVTDQQSRTGTELLKSGITVEVEGRPYDVLLEDSGDGGSRFGVYPVDPDGCAYSFSVGPSGDGPWVLLNLLTFMAYVELHPPDVSSATQLQGRDFSAALPAGWVYFDAQPTLTAAAELTLAELPAAVAAEVRADLEFYEGSEVLYPSVLSDVDLGVLVVTICGYPGWTVREWEDLNVEDYRAQDLEMVVTGDQVVIGGAAHEVWEVVRASGVERFVLPVTDDGCLVAFALQGPGIDDVYPEFLSFVESVEFKAP